MLKDLLTDDYNKLRPKDAKTRRQRTFQMRSCKRLKASENHNHSDVEDASQAIEMDLPEKVNDGNPASDDVGFQSTKVPADLEMTLVTRRSIPSLSYVSHESCNLEPNANGQVWSPTFPSSTSTGDSAFSWANQASNDPTRFNTASDQFLMPPYNDPVLPSIAEDPLDRIFPSEDNATFGWTSSEDNLLHPRHLEVTTDNTTAFGTLIEASLSSWEPPADQTLFLGSSTGGEPMSRKDSGQSESVNSLGIGHESGSSGAPQLSTSERDLAVRNVDYVAATPAIDSSTAFMQAQAAFPGSSLNPLIAGMLPYHDSVGRDNPTSLSQNQAVAITTESRTESSVGKAHTVSVPSTSLNPQNLGVLRSSGNHYGSGNARHYDRGSEAGGSGISSLVDKLSQCSTHERKSIKDVLRCSVASVGYRSGRERLLNNHRRPPEFLEMPGRFIASTVNTFAHHIACEWVQGDNPGNYCPDFYCMGCCLRPNSASEKAVLSVPFAVMLFKRGEKVDEIWTSQSVHWSDRFGNTALHIAAALGAGIKQLVNIMDSGVNVNDTNTAGQTFMHVLNPKCVSDPYEYRHLEYTLIKRSFDFARLDVGGQTFISSIVHNEIPRSGFLYNMLDALLKRDEEGHLSGCTFAKQLFERRIKFKEPMYDMRFLQSSCRDVYFGVAHRILRWSPETDRRALLKMRRDSLISLKLCEDCEGRNCLHMAVSYNQSGELSQDPFYESCETLVKTLLEIGVHLEHRDMVGETPLMAHIRSLPRKHTIIEMLLNGGANPNSRNEEGESALHISIQLGHIYATTALLSHGANVHVRNQHGRGVLALGNAACSMAESDATYARISACMALAADAGAVAEPDLFQEWSVPEYQDREECRVMGEWSYQGEHKEGQDLYEHQRSEVGGQSLRGYQQDQNEGPSQSTNTTSSRNPGLAAGL